MNRKILIIVSLIVLWSCNLNNKPLTHKSPANYGNLFIIGGGLKSKALVKKMVSIANIKEGEYAVILPLASEMPDTAVFYDKKMLAEASVTKTYAIKPDSLGSFSDADINLLRGAQLIYISGGDQNKFMEKIRGTSISETIHDAYKMGATIAGTSAGAAIMSHKMITGNQLKHPVYTGAFKGIEANNIEILKGLGLVKNAIIDQHFIKRQRMNRLITACLENPNDLAIGIDESTALWLKGQKATVVGDNQVISIRHTTAETKVINGLLGGQNLELNVYLPGDTFVIK